MALGRRRVREMMCDEPVMQVRDLQALGTSVWQQLSTQEQSSRETGAQVQLKGEKSYNNLNMII